MSLLGFIYLVVIMGWIFLVLVLKCKKSMTTHVGLQDNYSNALDGQRDQRRHPSVHVIQLERDDPIHEDRLMGTYRCQSRRASLLDYHSQYIAAQRSVFNEQRPCSFHHNDNCNNTYSIDAIINLAYNHEDEGPGHDVNNQRNHHAPPSYEEVMSQPEIYPKVHEQRQQQLQQQQHCGKITEEHI